MLEEQIPEAELRQLYIKGNLRQRYGVALDRLNNPSHGPNQLVVAVAAMEGFSRAIAVKRLSGLGETVESAYGKVRWTKPVDLLTDHVLPFLGVTPTAFDPEKWALVPQAIEYRNLLVHEATYLSGGTCDVLIEAVVHVFERIAELSGAKSAF